MSVGFPMTKADFDQKAGGLVVDLRNALDRCKQFCDLLNDTSLVTDASLAALGYTGPGAGTDITYLRNAFTDLKALYNVSHAAATVPAVSDFFFSAKHLTGVVLL